MTHDSITATPAGGMVFTGKGVGVYAATVIASALRLYARTGIKVNRAYTPSAMLAKATEITGQTFRGRDKYMNAADALRQWARAQAGLIAARNHVAETLKSIDSGKEGSQG